MELAASKCWGCQCCMFPRQMGRVELDGWRGVGPAVASTAASKLPLQVVWSGTEALKSVLAKQLAQT